MKPPISIIVFTVLSGGGLGLAVMLAVFAGSVSDGGFFRAIIAAFVLTAAGLGASVGHLANPKNAWRAVMRVRSSWLSREAVLAALFFLLAAVWVWRRAAGDGVWWGLAAAMVALLTVYCTAMIYQSLKPIPAWHHPLTAVSYLSFSLASGGALLALVAAGDDAATSAAFTAVCFAVIAAVGKWLHYRRIGAAQAISVGRATGFTEAKVRLLEAGHTGPTFLTREFIFEVSAATIRQRRIIASVLYLAAPVAVSIFTVAGIKLGIVAAVILMFAGIFIERWLFFAEAKHTVRLYHGS